MISGRSLWAGSIISMVVLMGSWLAIKSPQQPLDVIPSNPTGSSAVVEEKYGAKPVKVTREQAMESLDLVLLNTTTGSDPNRYRAHIEDRIREERFVVTTGDTLPDRDNVIVEEIASDQVTIDQDGKKLVIYLDETAILTDSIESPTLEDITAHLQAGDLEMVGEGLRQAWAMQVGARNEKALITQGRFAQKHDESGQMIGLFASQITPGSFFDQLGIKEDDIILEVNGLRLNDKALAASIMPILMNDTDIRIVLQGADGKVELDSKTVLPN